MAPQLDLQVQRHIFFHDLPFHAIQHGDHIRVPRIKGVYWHHGLACEYKALKKVIYIVLYYFGVSMLIFHLVYDYH